MSDDEIDLNQAGVDDLKELPGIGQALASRIVEHREDKGAFESVSELVDVSGVSDQMVRDLEEYLTVQVLEAELAPKEETKKEETAVKVETPVKKKTTQSAGKKPVSEEQLQDFRTAARSGDVKKVQALIKNGLDGHDKFALIWAAESGHSQVAAELIKAGADVNSKTASGGTNALVLAAQNGHLEIVQMLVEAGADVNEPGIEGWTPLMKAAYFNHGMIAQTLLTAGARFQSRNTKGQTAMALANQAGNQQIIDLLRRPR